MSLLFTGTHRRRTPSGSGRSAPGHPRRSSSLGSTTERWSMVSGRAADPNRANEATASFVLADRLHLEVGSTLRLKFVAASGFAATAAAAPEQLRQAAERRSRRERYVDRRPRHRTRRHVPDHRHRGVAARVPAARARPLTRAASHAGVRPSLRAPDRLQSDHVRPPQAAGPPGRVRQGHRTAGERRARRFHREPPAATAEGRDRDPGRGHRASPRRVARGARAALRRRAGPAPPGVLGVT